MGHAGVVGAKSRNRICMLLGVLPADIKAPHMFQLPLAVCFYYCAYASSVPQGKKRITPVFIDAVNLLIFLMDRVIDPSK
jgi:hypothetical protein